MAVMRRVRHGRGPALLLDQPRAPLSDASCHAAGRCSFAPHSRETYALAENTGLPLLAHLVCLRFSAANYSCLGSRGVVREHVLQHAVVIVLGDRKDRHVSDSNPFRKGPHGLSRRYGRNEGLAAGHLLHLQSRRSILVSSRCAVIQPVTARMPSKVSHLSPCIS